MKTYISTLLILFSLSILQAEEWKVRVYLNNGATMSGVVLDDAFFELYKNNIYTKVDSLNKIIASDLIEKEEYYTSEKGRMSGKLGIRLWYVNYSNGYLFILHKKVKKITFIDEVERQNIIKKVNSKTRRLEEIAEKKRKEERERQARIEKSKTLEASVESQKAKLDKKLIKLKLSKEEKAVLEEFPLGEEWNEEERNKIHKQLNAGRNNVTFRTINGRRIVQRNLFRGVNKKERKFYKQYELWTQALNKKRQIEVIEESKKAIIGEKSNKEKIKRFLKQIESSKEEQKERLEGNRGNDIVKKSEVEEEINRIIENKVISGEIRRDEVNDLKQQIQDEILDELEENEIEEAELRDEIRDGIDGDNG